MQNIPTDLLRTLILVVDLRSFTKASQVLGITQPAVSAQIGRLRTLIGCDLLDKSTPGVCLSPRGVTVVAQARRLLAINDEILQAASGRLPPQTLRVGIPGDYSGSRIPATLARFRLRWPDIGFTVTSGASEAMMRDLSQGNLDLVIAVTDTPPTTKPRHLWMRQAVWVRSDATRVSSDKPVPLVAYADDCACKRLAIAALSQIGRKYDMVYTSVSQTSLAAAVGAGFGVMVMPRGRALRDNVRIWEDAPLPPLPQLFCGIYVRDGASRSFADELADDLDADLRAEVQPPEGETGQNVALLRASSA
ncbi:MAG: LysR family transcriptional regulator [Hyphomicrobiales bacterium]|nr:LysR family transcriptional regulator [Hyphomicrobiales bacterium]